MLMHVDVNEAKMSTFLFFLKCSRYDVLSKF